jgi:hypothetical protein
MKCCRRWYILLPQQTVDQSSWNGITKLVLRPLGCPSRKPAAMAYFLPSMDLVVTLHGCLHNWDNLPATGVIE